MSNRPPDLLFQLIRSLEKAEKRHFKLYIRRSSGKADLKVIRLFDAVDRMKEYDDQALLRRMDGMTRPQLANLKAHLYRQILASLRLLKSADSIDLQLNEQLDHAHILYKKGLFLQSLRLLERARELARVHQKFHFLNLVLALEKRIEGLHITRSMKDRAAFLSGEALEVSRHIESVTRLSNLALRLYSWYIDHGQVRDAADEKDIREFMQASLPADPFRLTGFYERLYLYQSFSWYAFIRQDFLQYYRYARKWVELFDEQPLMVRVETGHCIKGMHNLLNAHFDLLDHRGFDATLARFEALAATPRVQDHDNFRIQAFIYLYIARINRHFMRGTYNEGLALVPELESRLQEYHLFVDRHRILVLHYKIAMLYFGSGDYHRCIDYLQRIIQDKTDLRYDLQCYTRLLHLLAHYELGNDMLMESLSKSVYRFMARMKHLTAVEAAMFRFLRQSIPLSPRQLRPGLEAFLADIKHLENDRFQTKAFAYLDIISWVEGKVYGKPMSEIVREKYLRSRHR